MRGNNVGARIQSAIPTNVVYDTRLNDLFLHALFARLAFKNNETYEFRTKYNHHTNTIELDIPDKYLGVLDQITGMQRGPNFKKFINWLIGSEQLQGDDKDVSSKFLSTSDINLWYGASYLDINGGILTIALPPMSPSAINANFKTAPDYNGNVELKLNWIYVDGQNTELYLKTNVTVIDSSGNSYVAAEEVMVSTFNLIGNDLRSTTIIELQDIGPDSLIDIILMRNYQGSSDPLTETVGVVGIELVM
jgi:hypothetical protein